MRCGEGAVYLLPYPPSPVDPSGGPPCQSLGGQPRNLEAEPPFQSEHAKTSYPEHGSVRGSTRDHLGYFGFGFEVLELGHRSFDVSGLGFEVSWPVLEVMCSSRFGLLWVLGSGFELLGLGFEDWGLGFGLLRLSFKVFGQRFMVSGPPGLASSCAGFNPF